MKTFLCHYYYEGEETGDKAGTWCVEVKADSHADAQRRLRAMANGEVDGELIASIPASLGWLARSLVAIRNWAMGY